MTTEKFPMWQSAILKAILHKDGEYHKAYTMPRMSGVTTFLPKLVSELQIFSEDKERIVVVVPNHYMKAELEFSLSGGQNSGAIAIFGAAPKKSDNLKIITAGQEIHFTSYIDWLITDNVDTVNVSGLTINNSLRFWTN